MTWTVTPCVGVWIETLNSIIGMIDTTRHTLRGCVDWNSKNQWLSSMEQCHTLRGCVDWNPVSAQGGSKCPLSHPAWVCGLKPAMISLRFFKFVSHPAWVCGLKLTGEGEMLKSEPSHPAWVCGLKLELSKFTLFVFVTPCVGVWIETSLNTHTVIYRRSHPAWVCGLKQTNATFVGL